LSFGDVLRRVRLNHAWSEYQLAEKTGIKRNTIHSWERGRSLPKGANFTKLIKPFTPHEQYELCEVAGYKAEIDIYISSETPEEILERLKLAQPVSIPVYTDFRIHQKAKEEEMRYIQLYGKGRITELSFETVIEKVRETVQSYEKKLRDLQIKRESLERVAANTDKLTESARVFSSVLHTADYPLKVKALEALDIRVTYTPDKSIVIDGLLPVGATDFQTSLHSGRRSSLSFHFVCK